MVARVLFQHQVPSIPISVCNDRKTLFCLELWFGIYRFDIYRISRLNKIAPIQFLVGHSQVVRKLPDSLESIMNIRTLCLGILYFREATGYEINKTASEGNFSHFIMASYGSIYPTLTKLEADGLLTCREEVVPGKPTRKVYGINDLGRAALIEAVSEIPKGDIFKSEFMFQCLCSEMVEPSLIQKSIELQIMRLRALIERLEQAGEECGHKESQFVIEYGLSINRAALSYLLENGHKLVERSNDETTDVRAAE